MSPHVLLEQSGAGGAAFNGLVCYPPTLTTVSSDATTNYQDYLSFTVPANDMTASGDIVELTLACDLTNGSGVQAFLVQQLQWGPNTVSVYPSDHFTPWANGTTAQHYLYRLLFQRVPDASTGDSIYMSDLRSQWGPYSMGLGTNAPSPGTVTFNALNFGAVDFTMAQTVTLRARWTKSSGPSFPALGTGATLAPLTARVFRYAC